MDPEEQHQLMQNISQKKRNRNKSNNLAQLEAALTITPEEIPIEDAMKAVTLAPHQVQNIFQFIFPRDHNYECNSK